MAAGRWQWVSLVALAGLTLGVGLGGSGRLTYHEAITARAAGEMLAEGDWLVPRLGGQPWLEKPPLNIWAVALVGRVVGGIDEAAARWPSMVAAALLALGGRDPGHAVVRSDGRVARRGDPVDDLVDGRPRPTGRGGHPAGLPHHLGLRGAGWGAGWEEFLARPPGSPILPPTWSGLDGQGHRLWQRAAGRFGGGGDRLGPRREDRAGAAAPRGLGAGGADCSGLAAGGAGAVPGGVERLGPARRRPPRGRSCALRR